MIKNLLKLASEEKSKNFFHVQTTRLTEKKFSADHKKQIFFDYFFRDKKNFFQPKNFFRVQTTRHAVSLHSSLPLSAPELRAHKAMCNPVVLVQKSPKPPGRHSVDTFVPGLIQAVSAKTAGSHMALHGNFSGPVSTTDPIQSSKDSASLVVCTQKKFFWLGVADYL